LHQNAFVPLNFLYLSHHKISLMSKYALGLDVGSSFVKCAIIDLNTCEVKASVRFPDTEMAIASPKAGWAEQHPEDWWQSCIEAMRRAMLQAAIKGSDIACIGIAYQMHGLVAVDNGGNVVRPAIIWCDSRAVACGDVLANKLSSQLVREHLYNHPGNFTASKLSWVQQYEPQIYHQISQIMLPGDYIAYKLSGQISTSDTGLSEGVFYDFKTGSPCADLLQVADFDPSLIPVSHPSFALSSETHNGLLSELGIPCGIPITYRAGDQPNNAWSLGVLSPGEAAATAGTSGVVYVVTDQVQATPEAGFNTFAHVNHHSECPRLGNLLCINGTGILYRWLRQNLYPGDAYTFLNAEAENIPAGAEGVCILPFGNGAERMLAQQSRGMSIHHVDLNRHGRAHLLRAGLEGIAFAFCYGLEKMKKAGVTVDVMRAGNDNLFQSAVFSTVLQVVSRAHISVFETNGAAGAAAGAAVGLGRWTQEQWQESLREIPQPAIQVDEEAISNAYTKWKQILEISLKEP
jgi:xylulokinase